MIPQKLLQDLNTRLSESIEHTRNALRQIRSSSPSPALVENIEVTTYGGNTKMTLNSLATIVKDSPNSLIVHPFDISTLKDIETYLLKANLGFSLRTEGNNIRLLFPPLSEEQREKLAKVVNQIIEEGKESMRNIRDDIRKRIKIMHENKELSEDERFKALEEIDKITSDKTNILDELKEKKVNEIMTV